MANLRTGRRAGNPEVRPNVVRSSDAKRKPQSGGQGPPAAASPRTEDLVEHLEGLILSLGELLDHVDSSTVAPAVEQSPVASTTLTTEDSLEYEVWKIYSGVERLVAVLKFRLSSERLGIEELASQGRSAESSPGGRLRSAYEIMRRALMQIESGGEDAGVEMLYTGLGSARRARDELRAFLADARRTRRRRKSLLPQKDRVSG